MKKFSINPKIAASNNKNSIGEYQIIGKLGTGLTAQVYSAQSSTHGKVSIKIIQPEFVSTATGYQLIKNQINILSSLDHKNVLKFIEKIQKNEKIHIITNFCEGGNLENFIRKNKKLTESMAVKMLISIVQGCIYLKQKNIIHRDIKPSNIFLKQSQPILADFGFAVYQTNKKLLNLNAGSPLYMPHESLTQKKFSQKSDVFALGVCLFEMLTGRTPWKANSQRQLIQLIKCSPKIPESISPNVSKLINKCISKQATNRPTFEDMLEQLNRISLQMGKQKYKQNHDQAQNQYKQQLQKQKQKQEGIIIQIINNNKENEIKKQQKKNLSFAISSTCNTNTNTNSNSTSNTNSNLNSRSNTQVLKQNKILYNQRSTKNITNKNVDISKKTNTCRKIQQTNKQNMSGNVSRKISINIDKSVITASNKINVQTTNKQNSTKIQRSTRSITLQPTIKPKQQQKYNYLQSINEKQTKQKLKLNNTSQKLHKIEQVQTNFLQKLNPDQFTFLPKSLIQKFKHILLQYNKILGNQEQGQESFHKQVSNISDRDKDAFIWEINNCKTQSDLCKTIESFVRRLFRLTKSYKQYRSCLNSLEPLYKRVNNLVL